MLVWVGDGKRTKSTFLQTVALTIYEPQKYSSSFFKGPFFFLFFPYNSSTALRATLTTTEMNRNKDPLWSEIYFPFSQRQTHVVVGQLPQRHDLLNGNTTNNFSSKIDADVFSHTTLFSLKALRRHASNPTPAQCPSQLNGHPDMWRRR